MYILGTRPYEKWGKYKRSRMSALFARMATDIIGRKCMWEKFCRRDDMKLLARRSMLLIDVQLRYSFFV